MKKYFYIIAAACLIACNPSEPKEESIFLSEDEIATIVAQDGGKLYTINEFLDTFMSEEGDEPYASHYRTRSKCADGTYLFSIDTIPAAGNGIYLRGRVTTDDYGGNFYKVLCIQQFVNGKQQALRISVDGSSISGMYPRGQEILIRCNGLSIGRYADQPQLCVPSYNNNYTASSADQKVGWAPGRIPMERFAAATHRIGTPDITKLKADTITISSFIDVTAEKEMRYLDAHLVYLKGIWFTGEYFDTNNNGLACTTGNPEEDTNANVFAPTTTNIGYPQSRVITDGSLKTLISNSEYAKHAYFYLPGANAQGVAGCSEWVGNVTGILGQYRDNARYDHDFGDWSISICDLSDLKLYNDEGEAWYPNHALEYGTK